MLLNCFSSLNISVFILYTKLSILAFLYRLDFEKMLERKVNHFNFQQMQIDIETDSAFNYFQFISIRSCAKISLLENLIKPL